MDRNKDILDSTNKDNGLTRINRAIYHKFAECKIPGMIAAKPAYNLAQMYIQALDFIAKTNELGKLNEAKEIAEKILELREAIKSLRHFSDRFARGYYSLMDKLNEITGNWPDELDEEIDDSAEGVEEVLGDLDSDELRKGLKDELEAYNRQQYGNIVKKLISKGCPEEISNYFADNLFELKLEAGNLVSLVDHLIALSGDYENLVFDVEEALIELSIPWIGFSPGETAHALWHIGDHDDDNFFFMGFLGWSLAVLENLQENIDEL